MVKMTDEIEQIVHDVISVLELPHDFNQTAFHRVAQAVLNEREKQALEASRYEAEIARLKAEMTRRGRELIRKHSTLAGIVAGIEDEGDRACFGSTNDADALRELAESIEEFALTKPEMDAVDWPALARGRLKTLGEAKKEIERLRKELQTLLTGDAYTSGFNAGYDSVKESSAELVAADAEITEARWLVRELCKGNHVHEVVARAKAFLGEADTNQPATIELVERLRSHRAYNAFTDGPLVLEAADRITALEAEKSCLLERAAFAEGAAKRLEDELSRVKAERDEAVATVGRLRGTLEYIKAQSVSKAYASTPAMALNVIRANAEAALDGDFQAAVEAARSFLTRMEASRDRT